MRGANCSLRSPVRLFKKRHAVSIACISSGRKLEAMTVMTEPINRLPSQFAIGRMAAAHDGQAD